MVQKSKNRPKYPTPPNRSKVFSEEQAPHFLLPDPTSDALPSSLPPRNSTTKQPFTSLPPININESFSTQETNDILKTTFAPNELPGQYGKLPRQPLMDQIRLGEVEPPSKNGDPSKKGEPKLKRPLVSTPQLSKPDNSPLRVKKLELIDDSKFLSCSNKLEPYCYVPDKPAGPIRPKLLKGLNSPSCLLTNTKGNNLFLTDPLCYNAINTFICGCK